MAALSERPYLFCDNEAFQGVEAIGNIALKTGKIVSESTNNRQKKRKNCDSNNKLSSIISKHFPLFSLDSFLIMVLLENGPSRDRFLILFRFYICCKFQMEYLKNSFWTDSNIFFLAEMQQQHFLSYQAKGSLRNDRQYDSIPHTPPPPPEGIVNAATL